jgi:hypothetical protein
MGFTLTLPVTPDLMFQVNGISDENTPHRWRLGSHGYGPHCPDCLELDGEIRTLGEWMNSVMPGSDCLQCGSSCRCSLESTISLPTTYNLFLPFGLQGNLNRELIFRDGSRLWRYNFTEVLHGSRPSAIRPGRAPSASLPVTIAAEPRAERFIDRRPRRWEDTW